MQVCQIDQVHIGLWEASRDVIVTILYYRVHPRQKYIVVRF